MAKTATLKLPEQAANVIVQPVSVMLRNCLIIANPDLKQLDYTHLQMYVPSITANADTFNAQLLVQQNAEVRYRLESKQVFTYHRISAEDGLNLLGIKDRIFNKKDFEALSNYISTVGEFTLISGDIHNEKDDAIFHFNFGPRALKDTIGARFISLASETFAYRDLDLVFNGVVKITFIGDAVEQPKVEDKTDYVLGDEDVEEIDVSSFFLHRNLGSMSFTGKK